MVDSLFRSVQDTNESYVAKKRRQQTTNYIQMHWDCGTNATTALCGFVAICCCARCFFYYVFQLFNVLINSFTQPNAERKLIRKKCYNRITPLRYNACIVYTVCIHLLYAKTWPVHLRLLYVWVLVSDFYFANTFISTELIAFFLLLYY